MLAVAQQHDLLPGTPTAVVAGLFAAAVALWVGSHRVGRSARGWGAAATLLLRTGAGFAALLAGTQLAGRVLLLTTGWPLWPVALGGAAAVEVLLGLYALERRTVAPATGLTLAALRVAMILLVVAMLTQPVFSRQWREEIRRYVAVLVDGSASMSVRDAQRPAAEKVRLAEALGASAAKRPVRLERAAAALRAVRGRLAAAVEDLAPAGADPAVGAERLAVRREALRRMLRRAREVVEDELARLAAARGGALKLDAPTDAALGEAHAALAVGVRDRLAKAEALLADGDPTRAAGRAGPLVETLRGAAAALERLAGALPPLADRWDEQFYASLSDALRERVDRAAGRSRRDLARALLLEARFDGDGSPGGGLLERLARAYRLKVYDFAADCVETDIAALRSAPAPASAPATGPGPVAAAGGAAPSRRDGTDLAAALETVARQMAGRRLAGVVVLTDGRHNGPRPVEPPARRLGLQDVPVCPVVLAPDRPPRDAAVLDVRAPQTVAEKDRFLLDARLKLDGLGGRDVEAALYDGPRRVAARTVHVPEGMASYRPAVQFSDEPSGAGLHTYTVRIEPQAGEVFAGNNAWPVTVAVTKDRVRLLLVDDRARWEFRYLKNLFADRDRNVRLQYVVLRPDRIEGAPPRKAVGASASRPAGQVEATDLPADEAEWMKFDVILLGDVPPARLDGGRLEILRKFVTRRGGTLIVIAGPNHMPHAYAGTPLEEILPVQFPGSAAPVGGALRKGFRLALTADGRDHPVMFQKIDPQENLAVWQEVPALFWRHPTTRARQGATVLAFAMPAESEQVPEFLRPAPASAPEDPAEAARLLEQRRAFERDHALLVLHRAAAGRVLMLTTDRTWRLRYRVGDTYHHRFWGQVMRWATADKLRAGTDYVKLGTDRTRYAPGRAVRVRAKITRPDLTPLVTNAVAVKLYRGERMVLRKALRPLADSPGLYEAALQAPAGGRYRLELDAPAAEPILALDKVRRVATEFSVDPVSGREQAELAADGGLLRRLAGLTGGVVVPPDRAGDVLGALGAPTLVRHERREYRLWDSWPLLVLLVLAATIEWALRKRVGLA